MKTKKGISLITLVITIIVIIILAGIIIVSINKNNPIANANEAKFKSDIDSFQSDLTMYHTNNYTKLSGQYEENKLQADINNVVYTGTGKDKIDVSGNTIKDVITSIKGSGYENDFNIIDGKLGYVGDNSKEKTWATESNVPVFDDKTNVSIITTQILPIKKEANIIYELAVRSNSGVNDISINSSNLTFMKENESGNFEDITNTLTIDNTSEIQGTDKEKYAYLTIDTSSLTEDGEYKIKLNKDVVQNALSVKNEETISNSFTIDNTAPIAPKIVSTPTSWTNQNITVTITYPADSAKNEYSEDGTNWQTYTTTLTALSNCTIYARAKDATGNVSGTSTLSITNIDKTAPQNITISTSLSGAVISANVTLQDNESGIDLTKSKYIVSTQSTVYDVNNSIWNSANTISSNSQTISYTATTSGNYYVQTLSVDKAGNMRSNISNVIAVSLYAKANAAVTEGSTATPLTVNSTIDGKNPIYNDPVIPARFFAVNTDVASWNNVSTDWNNGLVIQDAAGNQFVWVPVDGTNVAYTKDFSYPSNYGATSSNTSDDILPSDFDASKITSTYKGFYISRYEASFDYNGGTIRAKSTKSNGVTNSTNWSTTRNATYNGYLWNYISYTDSKSYSENMDTSYGYDTTKVGTNLITGQEWDTTMKWIQNAGINVATDSTTWGNYYDATFTYEYPTAGAKAVSISTLLNTGATSRNRAKNIYDLAGNLYEWTNEKYSTCFVVRGGYYGHYDSDAPAAYRSNDDASYTDSAFGFRSVLYIK